MPKLKVAIIFGGLSEEHPVSVKSAREVARNLNLAKYEPYYVGITRAGEWRLCAEQTPGEGPARDWEHMDARPTMLSPDRTVRGLLVDEGVPDDTGGTRRTIPIDVVLPVLHGRFGEDGAIQGLLELSGLPYVGCDVQSSALAMDKTLTALVTRAAGVAVPESWTVPPGDELDPYSFRYPVFVKPARSGSSFGVSRVDAPEELAEAIATAREFDSKVLIEAAVAGTEVGCAVLEGEHELLVGEVDQIRLSHGFFRVHQEAEPEVRSENSSVVVPAEITPAARQLVQQTARVIYRALGCRGLARVDLFLTESGEVVLNEVNTFPGFTSYSRYPRMMAAAGIALAEVLDRLIAFALAERAA